MIPLFTQLRKLAEAYFHEDYEEQATGPLGVIRLFRAQESPTAAVELAAEIDRFLASHTEAEIGDLWNEAWDAAYDPTEHGMTYREWFERVLEVLREPQ